jgi:hypothetical protein
MLRCPSKCLRSSGSGELNEVGSGDPRTTPATVTAPHFGRPMIAIMGATGHTGSVVAERPGQPIRAIRASLRHAQARLPRLSGPGEMRCGAKGALACPESERQVARAPRMELVTRKATATTARTMPSMPAIRLVMMRARQHPQAPVRRPADSSASAWVGFQPAPGPPARTRQSPPRPTVR